MAFAEQNIEDIHQLFQLTGESYTKIFIEPTFWT